MAWTILSTEQASFETDKGSFYYVKAYVNESLSAGESYSNPNIPSSVFSGKDVSFFASDYGFTPFVSIDGNVKAIHDTNRDAYYLQFYECLAKRESAARDLLFITMVLFVGVC